MSIWQKNWAEMVQAQDTETWAWAIILWKFDLDLFSRYQKKEEQTWLFLSNCFLFILQTRAQIRTARFILPYFCNQLPGETRFYCKAQNFQPIKIAACDSASFFAAKKISRAFFHFCFFSSWWLIDLFFRPQFLATFLVSWIGCIPTTAGKLWLQSCFCLEQTGAKVTVA